MLKRIFFAAAAAGLLLAAAVAVTPAGQSIVSSAYAQSREILAGTKNLTSAEAEPQFYFQGLGSQTAGIGITNSGVLVSRDASAAQNLTAAGAVTLVSTVTRLNTSSGTDVAITLADGIEGQEKIVIMETKGSTGNFVLTPTNLWGYATLTFNTVGDCAILRFSNGKWAVVSNQGATLA